MAESSLLENILLGTILLTSVAYIYIDHLYDSSPFPWVQHRYGAGAQPGRLLHLPYLDGL